LLGGGIELAGGGIELLGGGIVLLGGGIVLAGGGTTSPGAALVGAALFGGSAGSSCARTVGDAAGATLPTATRRF
jgi:hypothetical protein